MTPTIRVVVGAAAALIAAGITTTASSEVRLVDLTHPFDSQTIYWPTEEGFELIKGTAGVTARGYYYSANRFSAAEHGGTHVDAPIHFFADRQTVDQIPLSRLIGDGIVVDVSAACVKNPDYQVSVNDFRRWEQAHNRQLVDVIVLLRTGFAQHWGNPHQYLGTSQRGEEGAANLHFPGLDPQAAKWLVDHRAIKAIGIDTASIDYGQSRQFQSHVTLFEHNIPAFENVAILSNLPSEGFEVVALPTKIAAGTGAPLRIVAMIKSTNAAEAPAP